MHDVDKLGIGKIMEETLSYLGDRNLHLSFDIDSVDPFFAPHTGTAVRGGLNFREANYICEELWASTRLSSMELVEINPTINVRLHKRQVVLLSLSNLCTYSTSHIFFAHT